jgi:hypothetical protein
MTRDDAIKRITDALGPAASGASLADNQAFAQRLAAALDSLGLLDLGRLAFAPGSRGQSQAEASNPHQPTHHATDTSGTVSTPHPMTESRHGTTPGPTAADASWRRQPTPDDPTGAA